MNDTRSYDLAVIGSGPGGYIAAIYAARSGIKVICIEQMKTFGGTCLNVGCIPSKALLQSTEYFERVHQHGKEHGIFFDELRVDLAEMMKRKEKVVTGLTEGVAYLFKKYKVETLKGKATLLTPTTIQVNDQEIQAKSIILATGSEPIPLPFLPFDEKIVLSSTGALSLPKVPKKMLMIGAGIIGLELGSVYRRLGTEVEVIEILDRPVPTLDLDLSKGIAQILKKQGIVFHFNTKVNEARVNGSVELITDSESFKGDVVLVAIGRRPYTQGLGIETLGIEKDKAGRIVIDDFFRTSVPNIYAIGDLIEGPMLAHKASEEGIAAVDCIAGKHSLVNYLSIPNVMYTWPEVAAVGMTEQEAKEANLEILIGKMPFKAVPKARCSGDEEGFVKIIGEKNSDRVIGMHIIGANASEIIHEGVLAIEKKMTLEDLGKICHAHPTLSEGIKEAALLAKNRALQI